MVVIRFIFVRVAEKVRRPRDRDAEHGCGFVQVEGGARQHGQRGEGVGLSP